MTTTRALQAARDASRTSIGPSAAEYDRTGAWPERSIQALRDAKLLGLTVPLDRGGLGLGPTAFADVVEEIAAACGSTAMIFVAHTAATQVLVRSSIPRRDEIVGAIARGDHLTTLALSEKGSRSNVWFPLSQVRVEGGRQLLTVEKSWVTAAGQATSYVVSTRSANATGPMDSTLYHLENGARGVSVSGRWDGLGMRAGGSAPMRFDGCEVGTEALLSTDGGGFDVMRETIFPWFQLGFSSVANGIGRGALDATIRHLSETRLEHLGEALSSLPTLRAQLARAKVRLDASRALTREAARAMENPDHSTMMRVLESKALATEMVLEVTDAAMRLCGGAAFSRHLPVERHFRDARAGAVIAPTTDHAHEFIGKALLGMPMF